MKKMVFVGALRFVTLFSQQSDTFCISAVMHLNILLLSFFFFKLFPVFILEYNGF